MHTFYTLITHTIPWSHILYLHHTIPWSCTHSTPVRNHILYIDHNICTFYTLITLSNLCWSKFAKLSESYLIVTSFIGPFSRCKNENSIKMLWSNSFGHTCRRVNQVCCTPFASQTPHHLHHKRHHISIKTIVMKRTKRWKPPPYFINIWLVLFAEVVFRVHFSVWWFCGDLCASTYTCKGVLLLLQSFYTVTCMCTDSSKSDLNKKSAE